MKINSIQKDYSDDSDNEDDVQNDFFSINKPIDIKDELPLDIEQNMKKEMRPESSKKEVRSIESYFKKDIENHEQLEPANSTSETEMIYSAASSANPEMALEEDVVLDEEAVSDTLPQFYRLTYIEHSIIWILIL